MIAVEMKRRAALASIGASLLLAAGKLAAGLLSGSLALISDAGHAALDTIATMLTYFAVRAADKPADEEHHYGHAKIEAVTALGETALLFALALGVLYTAAWRLWTGQASELTNGAVAFAVLGLAVVVDLTRWLSLREVARRTGSHALAADALHFASDCVSSLLVLMGLLANRLGFQQGDTAAALGVAIFIGIAGWRLGERTLDMLLDAAPKGASKQVRAAIEAVPGVVGVGALRLRPSGSQLLGEVEVAVPRTMPIEAAEGVRAEIARAVSRAMPEANLTIAAAPRALDTETLRERIYLIAARLRASVHHVTVQDVDGRKSVSLDVEIDSDMAHRQAHEIASRLEAAIRAELGDVEVETHIEPLHLHESAGVDAGPATVAQIEAALARSAREGGRVFEVHGVRVRRIDDGLVVNYHCRVDGSRSVEAVHEAVDDLDHAVRSEFPQITRIVGHAEPLRS